MAILFLDSKWGHSTPWNSLFLPREPEVEIIIGCENSYVPNTKIFGDELQNAMLHFSDTHLINSLAEVLLLLGEWKGDEMLVSTMGCD